MFQFHAVCRIEARSGRAARALPGVQQGVLHGEHAGHGRHSRPAAEGAGRPGVLDARPARHRAAPLQDVHGRRVHQGDCRIVRAEDLARQVQQRACMGRCSCYNGGLCHHPRARNELPHHIRRQDPEQYHGTVVSNTGRLSPSTCTSGTVF